MKHNFCVRCHYCDIDRKNEKNQVRCKRYSQYVNPMDISCDGYLAKNPKTHLKLFSDAMRRKGNG